MKGGEKGEEIGKREGEMDNGKLKMENERSEPCHLKSGGVDNVKCKI